MIHEKQWCTSRQGQPIALYASSALKKSDHPLLLMGGVHGDEPEGVILAERTLAFLRQEAKKIQLPWILIPCLNIDGHRANQRCNGAGVDLNRNYPSKSWSPEYTKDRYFPGKQAGSEPEVQAVMKLIADFDPRLIVHCHSWQPCVVCAGQPGLRDAQRLSRCSGYEVKEDIGYPTPGSLSEYGWTDRQIPVICIEEAEKTSPDLVWPHFEPGIREIFADTSLRRDNLRP